MVKKTIYRLYLFLIILFLYAPIIVLIMMSFNDSRSRVVWGGFTFNWYVQMFSNHQIMEALGSTLVLALSASVIATIIGIVGAVGIDAMRKKEYAIVMSFTNIPMLNADIVTGIALMLFFVRFMPLGFTSVLLAHVTFCIPYVILSIMPKLKQLDVSVYEAACDLGATGVQAFFKIVLPSIYPAILSGFFLAFTMSLDDFVITYFTKGAGVQTLSTMIYGEIRKGIKPEMYALSTMIFAIILLVLIAMNYAPRIKEVMRRKGEAN